MSQMVSNGVARQQYHNASFHQSKRNSACSESKWKQPSFTYKSPIFQLAAVNIFPISDQNTQTEQLEFRNSEKNIWKEKNVWRGNICEQLQGLDELKPTGPEYLSGM